MELANFTTVRATACLWAGLDCDRSHSPTGGSPTQAGCSHICVKGAGRSPTERARLRLTHEDGARSGSPSLAGDRSLARTRNEAAPDREATASSVHTNPVSALPNGSRDSLRRRQPRGGWLLVYDVCTRYSGNVMNVCAGKVSPSDHATAVPATPPLQLSRSRLANPLRVRRHRCAFRQRGDAVPCGPGESNRNGCR